MLKAEVLMKFMEKKVQLKHDLFKDKTLLELGCGTGFCGLTCEKLGFKQIYLTDLSEVIDNITTKNIAINECDQNIVQAFELDWKLDIESLQKLLEERGCMNQMLDVIVASDLIFNSTQLEMVPRVCKDICEIYYEKFKQTPTILMSYKSRHEEIDEQLYDKFSQAGFDGEQANGKELSDDLLCEPIDVFILSMIDKEKSLEILKLDS
eukprot:403343653